MKRFILVLLIIASIILSGCNDEPDTSWMIEGGETDRFIYSSRMYGQLIRYDVVDQKATVACPDPMCEHGSDCLATNIFASYVGEEYIVCVRLNNGILGGNTMYSLDLKTGSYTKVMECPRFQQVAFINDFALFSGSRVIYNEDGSVKGEVWDVYKYYMGKNELIKINKESLNDGLYVANYTDDRIIWCDLYRNSGYDYFETDYNFENLTPCENNLCIGEYEYEIDSDYAEDGSITFDISRKHIKTGDTEVLLSNITSYRLDNINDPKGIVYNSFIEDKNKFVIRYISLGDLSVKKLAGLPRGYTYNGSELVFPNIGTSLYANGYVGVYVTSSDHDLSDGHNSNTMFFVNIENGENFVINP